MNEGLNSSVGIVLIGTFGDIGGEETERRSGQLLISSTSGVTENNLISRDGRETGASRGI